MITEEILNEFKERMHISHSEDSNLKRLLSFSVEAIKSNCGEFDINGISNVDTRARELVFERTRYAYNEALEYFEDNFLKELNSLSIDIALKEDEEDATI